MTKGSDVLNLYTIGFTKKTAEQFFGLLNKSQVDVLIDVRLNNKSQLSGFAKGQDLKYFLNKLCGIKYYYEETFAPTEELLKKWKNGAITWQEYEKEYESILDKRNAEELFDKKYIGEEKQNICFLCSESTPEHCHRRLLAEYLVKNNDLLRDVSIINL